MKKIIWLLFLICSVNMYSQNIENTLGTNGDFIIKDASNTYFTLKQSTGLLGIGAGVISPRAQLEVGGYDGILSTGAFSSGTALSLGAGVRMHWYPKKGAFRAGVAQTTYWDDANIGDYSIAMGYLPRATGSNSVAIGYLNYATGQHSLALGANCQAQGDYAIAIGYDSWATGRNSVCIGQGTSSNGTEGSVLIGDNTPFARIYASNNNQMTTRFAGGYRLFTSYSDSAFGVYMRGETSGWSNYCDRNKKENFEEIDLEDVLAKIKGIPITKWNYKGGDVLLKYIGPMAQDFYAAFHLNGTDSLGINSISIDGVNMAAAKALEKRTADMQKTIDMLVTQNEILVGDIEKLKKQLENLANLENDLAEINRLKSEFEEKLKLLGDLIYSNEKDKTNVAVTIK